MDSKKSSEHLEEFDLKDITTHFGGISDLLGFDQLEHAAQVSVLQARMMRALKELRIKNNDRHPSPLLTRLTPIDHKTLLEIY